MPRRRGFAFGCTLLAVSAMAFAGQANAVVAAPLSRAYEATLSARTAAVALTIDTTTASGRTASVTASGVVNWLTMEANLQLRIGAAGKALTLKELMVGGLAYVQVPARDAAQAGGKQWLSLNLNQLVGNSSSGEDPTQGLAILESRSTSVRKLGMATIEGVPTTEYQADLDLNKAPAGASPALKKLITSTARSLGTTSLPTNVWIDGAGRVRQMRYAAVLHQSPAATTTPVAKNEFPLTIVFQENMTNFGVPVSVTAPPPSEVKPVALPASGTTPA